MVTSLSVLQRERNKTKQTKARRLRKPNTSKSCQLLAKYFESCWLIGLPVSSSYPFHLRFSMHSVVNKYIAFCWMCYKRSAAININTYILYRLIEISRDLYRNYFVLYKIWFFRFLYTSYYNHLVTIFLLSLIKDGGNRVTGSISFRIIGKSLTRSHPRTKKKLTQIFAIDLPSLKIHSAR